MDNVAARSATEYLIGIGHRRTGYLSAYNKYYTVGQRFQGYKETFEAAGIPFDPALCVTADPVHDELVWDKAQEKAAVFA